MTVIEDWRRFAASYPKHRLQTGGLQAYERARAKATASELQYAVRRFSAEVRAARPTNGKVWKFCPGPARWLTEERWRAYLPTADLLHDISDTEQEASHGTPTPR